MGRTLMTAGIALQTQPFFLKILERKLMVNGVPCERGGVWRYSTVQWFGCLCSSVIRFLMGRMAVFQPTL